MPGCGREQAARTIAAHAPAAPAPHSDGRLALPPRRDRRREPEESDIGPVGALDDVRRAARCAWRAAAPRARGPRPDFREVRTAAVDAPRPAADRHRGRARQAAGRGAAVSVADRAARDRARSRAPDRRSVFLVRRRAGGLRLDRAGAFRDAARRSSAGREVAVKVLRPNMLAAIDKDLVAARYRRSARRAAVARRQAAAAA